MDLNEAGKLAGNQTVCMQTLSPQLSANLQLTGKYAIP